ncbi:tRNA-dihydrouridine synthase family protein [Neochlamydia sp. AcF95]|uniref:tRNA dihydrouridine synthase n=1 Tax=Neochlamydia sp. AcF95 TaxID=2795734 RepID=UPI001BCA4928|nr:tRNA-dihydrouridine synthase family protein [Neochlamydia sp. AcF95]MBS4171472.1 tRNA-dihydrouridine(16) synthase [Neochlamydia sp. AcF95]
MHLLSKDAFGCPYLFLAPMEGVGDRCFRKAMATIGGFDEGVTEFIRVPSNAHAPSLAKVYDSHEISPIPLAAQLMGSEPNLMAEMALEIARRGAPRIDLNCGCPSNKVTGRGAGSSLLKEPRHLYEVARALVKAVKVPVTVKMRSGYEDTSLFKENLLAAQESGACFITLHPRTKVEGYGPPARWDLIAEAKSILKIPVVGNGDILCVEDAVRMLKATHCDALMVGRGSVINPFIFHQIRAYFSGKAFIPTWDSLDTYLRTYLSEIPLTSPVRNKINKMKQLLSFLYKANPQLSSYRQHMLTSQFNHLDAFMEDAMHHLKNFYI